MVYGKVVTPPVRYGATVKSVDDAAAKKVPGFIKAVTLDDKTGSTTGWVVAVANTYASARKAADALKITYDNGPNAKLSSQSLLDEAKRLQALDDSGQFFVKDGDTAAAFGTAAKVLEAEYTTSINIHAPLEPMNATAEFKGDIWHIYSGNQFATRSGAIAAGAAGIDPKFVVMHQMWLGGGFGRRLDADMMVPAVQAAKAVGKPVKVIYSRENDMTMDYSRPLTFQKVKAGLDGDGKLIALNHDVVCAWPTAALGHPRFPVAFGRQEGTARCVHRERRGLLLFRAQSQCPRHQERDGAQRHPVGTVAVGRTGLDLLGGRKHDRRTRACRRQGSRASTGSRCWTARARTTVVRNACATRCWRRWAWPATAPANCRKARAWASPASRRRSGQPQAGPPAWPMSRCQPRGEVKVKKLTVATDVGMQVHPDNIRAQVEGAALWGLSLAMYEKATLKDGGIEQTNFDTYTPLADEPDAGSRRQRHRQRRQADRRRRAGGDGDRACARQRHLQRLRRAHPRVADHGRSGEGEHEGVNRRSID